MKLPNGKEIGSAMASWASPTSLKELTMDSALRALLESEAGMMQFVMTNKENPSIQFVGVFAIGNNADALLEAAGVIEANAKDALEIRGTFGAKPNPNK